MRSNVLTYLASLPGVIEHVAPGYSWVSLDDFLDRSGNFAFGDRRGAVIFAHRGKGVYEMHYLFGPSCRGPFALRRLRAAIAAMFTDHGAAVIVGETPIALRQARAVNRALGGKPTGSSVDTLGRPCITYQLDRAAWAESLGAL